MEGAGVESFGGETRWRGTEVVGGLEVGASIG